MINQILTKKECIGIIQLVAKVVLSINIWTSIEVQYKYLIVTELLYVVVKKDINIKKKHIKPKKEGEVGRISQFEAPIDSSNVMLYNVEKKIASRICIQTDANGTKIRVLKKLL